MRNFLIPVAIVLLGVLLTAGIVASSPEAEQIEPKKYIPNVRVQVVEPSLIELTILSQGTVKPVTMSNTVSQVAGQIIYRSEQFSAGSFLKKGALMVRVDPADYKLAKARAEQQVAQAELNLAREQEEAELALAEWDEVGNGTPSNLVLRKPQLKEAKATLKVAREALEQAITNLNRTEIRAPYNCLVQAKNADLGQVLNPGTVVARIYSVTKAEVRLPVPDAELAYLEGFGTNNSLSAAEVEFEAEFAGATQSWKGKLKRMEGEIDPTSRMVFLVAEIEDPYNLKNEAGRSALNAGIFVNAKIYGKRIEKAITIKRAALHNNNTVWLIRDGKLFQKQVEVLRKEKDRVIISSGLQAGDKVCLTNLDAVIDGMDVHIN